MTKNTFLCRFNQILGAQQNIQLNRNVVKPNRGVAMKDVAGISNPSG